MNYASFRISKKELPKVLTTLCANIKHKFPKLSPTFNISEGVISFKPGCIMPFYLESRKLIFASVDIHGMYHEIATDSPWHDYTSSPMVLEGYTYLTAVSKGLLCHILNQEIDDEGIGKYRDNLKDKKFHSLDAWRKYQLESIKEIYPVKLIESSLQRVIKQDEQFLPELL